VERIKPLLERARKNLKLLGLRQVELKFADGTLGWREKGPFDAILTTAAPQQIPGELFGQLAEGGRLIIPVGGEAGQELQLITRHGDEFHTESLQKVRFVPLLSGKASS
jgi:protein-L-isoaspartate(D-aspartate) O-methyltransferase